MRTLISVYRGAVVIPKAGRETSSMWNCVQPGADTNIVAGVFGRLHTKPKGVKVACPWNLAIVVPLIERIVLSPVF